MSLDRREFLAQGTFYLMLTGAASEAWSFIESGKPQEAPGYICLAVVRSSGWLDRIALTLSSNT